LTSRRYQRRVTADCAMPCSCQRKTWLTICPGHALRSCARPRWPPLLDSYTILSPPCAGSPFHYRLELKCACPNKGGGGQTENASPR
jgi:hypothetical protein